MTRLFGTDGWKLMALFTLRNAAKKNPTFAETDAAARAQHINLTLVWLQMKSGPLR